MIQVIQGFKLSTRDAVDNRLVLTKAEMLAIKDHQMPEKYFAVCKDDGCLYLYNKSREVLDPETGKFVQFSSSKIESISVNGVEIPIDGKNVDLPTATAERYGMIITGKGLKSFGGIVTLDFNSLDDKAIPFEKIDFDDVVIDGNNI